MALVISTQDLLNKLEIESNRIRFKKGEPEVYTIVCVLSLMVSGGYIFMN